MAFKCEICEQKYDDKRKMECSICSAIVCEYCIKDGEKCDYCLEQEEN